MSKSTARNTRRSILALAGIVAIAVIVVIVFLWAGCARGQAEDLRLEQVRNHIQPGVGWVAVDDAVRESAFLGFCPASALDVRGCPSSVTTYELQDTPQSAGQITAILSSDWVVTEPDCRSVADNLSGRFDTCSAWTEDDGFRVTATMSVEVAQGGSVSAPRVIVSVEPAAR